jgi:hypothetical protein
VRAGVARRQATAVRRFGSRKDDAMRIAQMNAEEKVGLPPPEGKGGCHGA